MLKVLSLAAALGSASVFAALPADALSWYPSECMTIDHCAPVENVALTKSTAGAPSVVISTNHRTATVKNTFDVRKSKDQRFHVCMRYDPFGDFEVTCLLVPSWFD